MHILKESTNNPTCSKFLWQLLNTVRFLPSLICLTLTPDLFSKNQKDIFLLVVIA